MLCPVCSCSIFAGFIEIIELRFCLHSFLRLENAYSTVDFDSYVPAVVSSFGVSNIGALIIGIGLLGPIIR